MTQRYMAIIVVLIILCPGVYHLTTRYYEKEIEGMRQESIRQEFVLLMNIAYASYYIEGMEHHAFMTGFISHSSREELPRYIFRARNHEQIPGVVLSSGKEREKEYSFHFPDVQVPESNEYVCGVRPLISQKQCHDCHDPNRRILGTVEACIKIE